MANTTVTPTTIALTLTLYIPILKEVVTPTTLALSDTEYAPVVHQGMTVEDSGGDSEALDLLIDVLLREIAGVTEDITTEYTPDSVSETGVGVETVTVKKTQSYKITSEVRPLYAIMSIIRGKYEMSPMVRGLYEFHTSMRGG